MSEEETRAEWLEKVRESMRDWETYKTEYNPDFARKYAGQWVVLHHGRVVAHGTNVTEVAQAGNVQKYPGAEMFHVPNLDKQDGVWLLSIANADR